MAAFGQYPEHQLPMSEDRAEVLRLREVIKDLRRELAELKQPQTAGEAVANAEKDVEAAKLVAQEYSDDIDVRADVINGFMAGASHVRFLAARQPQPSEQAQQVQADAKQDEREAFAEWMKSDPSYIKGQQVQADAERYQTIREHGVWLDPNGYVKARRVLDAAIDAMSREQSGGGE